MIHTLYLVGLQFAPDVFSFGLVAQEQGAMRRGPSCTDSASPKDVC